MDRNGISVIIPCYNDGQYITDAVQSVQCQTYRNFEIIIIDDGSTDSSTTQILERLNTDAIKVLHANHSGPAAARNYGISHAQGKYILPLDADDKIDPTYLEKAVHIMEENSRVGVVYCYADLFGEQTGRWELPDYSFSQMLLDNIVFVTALFYRADWETVGGFCEDLQFGMEDYDFWLSILELDREIYQIPEVLFHYRVKPKSRTTALRDDCEKIQQMYGRIFENHKALYRDNYDIIIPLLRNKLLEQLSVRNKIEGLFRGVDFLKKIPILKQFARWIIKKV